MNYFTAEELSCQHCGKENFDVEFLKVLNSLREDCNFPFPVTSGYRCAEHPIEAKKTNGPGAHTTGKAIDIGVSGAKALTIIKKALEHGIHRIGVNQKGKNRFIHLDMADDKISPAIWSY
tara:strand:+ start:132 stop:491 length:360 start_codon:yes stop_codon:yes gene_type:complete